MTQSSHEFRNVAPSCDQSAPRQNWHSRTVSEREGEREREWSIWGGGSSGGVGGGGVLCVREPGSRP